MPTTAAKPIGMADLAAQFSGHADRALEAVERVLRSGGYILGPEVAAFEEELAASLALPQAVAVSSGTDALLAALMALDVGPGDEVICPAFSFIATAMVIPRVGATPVFVDVEPDTFNVDPQRILDALTPRTKAVIAVHLFGRVAALDEVAPILRERGVALIEDAAQAQGATRDGRGIGSWGDVACISFFPAKVLGAAGDAGAVVTHRDDLVARLRQARVHGAVGKNEHASIGGNFRIDALQAALLRVKLPLLEGWIQARIANASRYAKHAAPHPALLDNVRLPQVSPRERHVFAQYVIRARKRDALKAWLADHGVASEIYYPTPLQAQACFGGSPEETPVAALAGREVLAIPVHPELPEGATRRVMETLAGFYEQEPA
ncbi:MAG: DegT/DnrJ/EryC1/StrS family aminotransferase [Myxococcales bacterium]|nr:DegT/DnrJ/EryC1/StrS family aminotransferase [Myxococcales bacterium]